MKHLTDFERQFIFSPSTQLIAGRELCKLFRQCLATPLNQSHLEAANYQLKMLDGRYRIISNLNRQAATTAKRSR